MSENVVSERKVGFGLGLGIMFMPYVFSWFTLRNGHTKLARGLSFGWLAFVILVNIWPNSNMTDSNNHSASVSAAEEKPIVVSAQKLHTDYHANEVVADDTYKGKVLIVSGEVEKITKNFKDDMVIIIKTENMFETVHATLQSSEKEKAKKLVKDQTIFVVCAGKGMIIGSPMLDDCIIHQQTFTQN